MLSFTASWRGAHIRIPVADTPEELKLKCNLSVTTPCNVFSRKPHFQQVSPSVTVVGGSDPFYTKGGGHGSFCVSCTKTPGMPFATPCLTERLFLLPPLERPPHLHAASKTAYITLPSTSPVTHQLKLKPQDFRAPSLDAIVAHPQADITK